MPTCSVRGVMWRVLLLFLTWILFGFATSAHLCTLSQMSPIHRKALCIQIIANVAGLLLLLGGGALVVGNRDGGNSHSNYVPCPNNVTMDRHCMYEQQPLSYLFPYIIHYIGGGYCLVGWFLDMCHLLPWAIQASSHSNATRERNIPMKNLGNAPAEDAMTAKELTLFCTVVPPPQERHKCPPERPKTTPRASKITLGNPRVTQDHPKSLSDHPKGTWEQLKDLPRPTQKPPRATPNRLKRSHPRGPMNT